MPSFTLREFERIGPDKSCELRFLGKRQKSTSNAAEGKQWLSSMIAEGQLEGERLYRLDAVDCSPDLRRDFLLNISFYLFPNGRLCPLRIWARAERFETHVSDPEWTVDFEGIPGWSLIAAIEPRWRLLRTVPAERSWMGRSRRDWQKRDCWAITSPAADLKNRAA